MAASQDDRGCGLVILVLFIIGGIFGNRHFLDGPLNQEFHFVIATRINRIFPESVNANAEDHNIAAQYWIGRMPSGEFDGDASICGPTRVTSQRNIIVGMLSSPPFADPVWSRRLYFASCQDIGYFGRLGGDSAEQPGIIVQVIAQVVLFFSVAIPTILTETL